MVYEKSLNISVLNNQKYTIGQLLNIMQIDCCKFEKITENVSFSLFYPVRIVIGVYTMYKHVKLHFFPGFLFLIVSTMLATFQGRKFLEYQRKVKK